MTLLGRERERESTGAEQGERRVWVGAVYFGTGSVQGNVTRAGYRGPVLQLVASVDEL